MTSLVFQVRNKMNRLNVSDLYDEEENLLKLKFSTGNWGQTKILGENWDKKIKLLETYLFTHYNVLFKDKHFKI